MTDLPLIPTGAAYSEHGWTAQAREIIEFMQTAYDAGLEGVNFWVWHHAMNLRLWDTIAQFPWIVEGEIPEPPSNFPVYPDSAGVKITIGDTKYWGQTQKVKE